MDKFINTLDAQKFRNTNAAWNELRLNDPWSIGYVSMLIELRTFSNKEEWEDFYYAMGAHRLKKMAPLSVSNQHILNNELMIKYEEARVNRLSESFRNINAHHGRTKNELDRKGQLLKRHIEKKHADISLFDCQEAVRYRVICESWNGIVLREYNTIISLELQFPNLTFLKKAGAFDHQYAVDYEIYHQSKLVCGIQIKPQSYLQSAPYLAKAKKANKQKNENYHSEYGQKVITIIANHKGQVRNMSALSVLEEFPNSL